MNVQRTESRRRSAALVGASVFWLLPQAALALARDASMLAQSAVPTVGTEGRLEVLLPHGDLEPVVAGSKAVVIVRVAERRPWGTGWRYDLRYIGFVPGEHDLAHHLRRADGTTPHDLPALPVRAMGVLPDAHDGALAGLGDDEGWRLPWYGWLAGAVLVAWGLLLIPLVLLGRRRKARAQPAAPPRVPTLAERLRPLVIAAAEGRLDAAGQGQLERLLLHVWRQRLALGGLPPAQAMARLREHAQAGPLVVALEDWLHRPPASRVADDREIARLLEPYRQLPNDDDADSVGTHVPEAAARSA